MFLDVVKEVLSVGEGEETAEGWLWPPAAGRNRQNENEREFSHNLTENFYSIPMTVILCVLLHQWHAKKLNLNLNFLCLCTSGIVTRDVVLLKPSAVISDKSFIIGSR